MAAPHNLDDVDSDSDDSDVAFANMDFTGVNFDDVEGVVVEEEKEIKENKIEKPKVVPAPAPTATSSSTPPVTKSIKLDKVITGAKISTLDGEENRGSPHDNNESSPWLQLEHGLLFNDYSILAGDTGGIEPKTLEWAKLIQNGEYIALLRASGLPKPSISTDDSSTALNEWMDTQLQSSSMDSHLQLEWIGIAALNIFLQVNYTGPSLDQVAQQSHKEKNDDDFHDIVEPYCGREEEKLSEEQEKSDKNAFHNRVLSELSVDGDWPCQVCQLPYWLLVARTLLRRIAAFQIPPTWWSSTSDKKETVFLPAARAWSLRAAVAHSRLFLVDEPSPSLWEEISSGFRTVLTYYCASVPEDSSALQQQQEAASIVLEWGLAQHFMERPGKGVLSFHKAMHYSGLEVEVTGAIGKRTKFQQDAIAQFQVKAKSRVADIASQEKQDTSSIAISHGEDEILLEKVRYEDDADNNVSPISILDQTILMALCLDVKNSNPFNDGLTAEEMGAYLSRVLDQSNDWMVYATALLERAWLEFGSSHSRERSILQLQALTDQHTNSLTMTQSTFTAVQEQSAPPQERLLHIHKIVYPPRWSMLRDLAERYANMGIVTSAAELFTEIELWDSVVECYKRAGKERLAKEICQERLAQGETPRMWAAMGELTNDMECYHKAIALSQGRFSAAYVALGKYEFDQGNLKESGKYYRQAVTLRPLLPHVWFRLGTIAMQLKDWSTALEAFSTVVQQEPEEADAWANVAAVHMHNRNPSEAYPALKESLKYARNNWRVWTSHLYTCIDLEKFDEAIQACNVLLDLQQAQSKVPNLEEKCIKAIVGKTLAMDRKADTVRRTLSREQTLLDRLSSSSAFATEAWIWEILAYFNQQVGLDEEVLENLLKEHRALQSIFGWEKDLHEVRKVTTVVCQIGRFYLSDGSKEAIVKCRYLVKGVLQKIKAAYEAVDDNKTPIEQIEKLEEVLEQALEATKKLSEEGKNMS